jgi:sporulation protein YunB
MRRPAHKPLDKQERRARRRLKIVAVLIVLVVLLIGLDSSLRPLIKQVSASRGRAISTQAINDAITQVMADQSEKYQNITTIRENESGEISSIETDGVKINSLKAAISGAVQKKLLERNYTNAKIPIGTLTGNELLVGRGPEIEVKLKLHGNVLSDLASEFSSAGINQTLHRVILKVKITVFIELPGYNTYTDVETNYVISETLIVGRVPEHYTDVSGIGLISDYPKS